MMHKWAPPTRCTLRRMIASIMKDLILICQCSLLIADHHNLSSLIFDNKRRFASRIKTHTIDYDILNLITKFQLRCSNSLMNVASISLLVERLVVDPKLAGSWFDFQAGKKVVVLMDYPFNLISHWEDVAFCLGGLA